MCSGNRFVARWNEFVIVVARSYQRIMEQYTVPGMSEERGRPDRRIRTDRRKYDRQTESEQTDADRTGRRNRIKQDADRSQTR